jgi:hypothetical protein
MKTRNDHEETKEKAKSLYLSIGRVWCPALNDYVVFNSIGFRHLMRKHGSLRLKSEQARRFNLIPLAVALIKNMEARIFHEKRTVDHRTYHHEKRKVVSEYADFWVLFGAQGNTPVKVVVRQLKNGEKHFFSVY